MNLPQCREPINPYLCVKCEYPTHLKIQLTHHLKKKHSNEEEIEESGHKCEHCPFRAPTLMFLLKHKITHLLGEVKSQPEEEPTVTKYVCEDCPFETHSCIIYLNHTKNCLVRRQKQKWHHCGKCGYKTLFFKRLESHILEIHWQECYACKFCFFKSRTQFGVEQHIRLSHANKKCIPAVKNKCRAPPNNWFRCEDCQYICKTVANFQRHIFMHHFSKYKPLSFPCEVCTFQATDYSSLRIHIRYSHKKDDLAKFKCSRCGYTAFCRSDVERHYNRRHSKTRKWFRCDQCKYKTEVENNLTEHVIYKHGL